MLYIGADHAGFQLKKYLARYLTNQLKVKFEDIGPHEYEATDDFPDFAIPLAQKVAAGPANRGILICGSGQGMCITANKIGGVRAIMGYSIEAVEMGRRHNNANVLCLAGRVLSEEHAAATVKRFLATDFDGQERLQRRIDKITALES